MTLTFDTWPWKFINFGHYHYQCVPNLRTIHPVPFELSHSPHLNQRQSRWKRVKFGNIQNFSQNRTYVDQPPKEHFYKFHRSNFKMWAGMKFFAFWVYTICMAASRWLQHQTITAPIIQIQRIQLFSTLFICYTYLMFDLLMRRTTVNKMSFAESLFMWSNFKYLWWQNPQIMQQSVTRASSLPTWVIWVDALWPSNVICQHGSWLTLAQVMACRLMSPSHYLNQYWLH